MGWEKGKVDGKKAKVKQDGKRVEALYNMRKGVKDPKKQKDHLVSNDGLNASYLREKGKTVVDDRKGRR